MTADPLLPLPPLPAPLRGTDIPSFANFSVAVRLPDIARRVLAENDLPPAAGEEIAALVAEIPEGRIRPLRLPAELPTAAWQNDVIPFLGQTWLEVPWFFAENYFYARILEATGYFEPGPWQERDPFQQQKQGGLDGSRLAAEALAQAAFQALSAPPGDLAGLLRADLLGNRADLSMWPLGSHRRGPATDDPGHLLIDDSSSAAQELAAAAREGRRVDLLVDNAGFELVGDLALAAVLLASGMGAVQLHLKAYPTFVSDALAVDGIATLGWMGRQGGVLSRLADPLWDALDAGRLRLRPDPFWNSPWPLWRMPATLDAELSGAALLISKGDAHYRRLHGDLHWPPTQPTGEVLSYLPVPVLLLRSLKSEIVTGLTAEQVEQAGREDPEWRIDGRWSLLQWVQPG